MARPDDAGSSRPGLPHWPFHIGRLANHFHIVNNLAEWHFACRRSYNTQWIAETGELTPAERDALAAFKDVALRYPYGDRWLGWPGWYIRPTPAS